MKSIVLFISLVAFTNCVAQKDYLKEMVYDLKNVEQMPEGREYLADSAYWMVVKQKINIVPYLIGALIDTTETKAYVPYVGGKFTIADIAYEALGNIIHGLPTLEMAEDSLYAEERNGYWGYWNYVRRSYDNRKKFKNRVEKWFDENKENLEWISYPPHPTDGKPTPFSHLEGYYRVKGSNVW